MKRKNTERPEKLKKSEAPEVLLNEDRFLEESRSKLRIPISPSGLKMKERGIFCQIKIITRIHTRKPLSVKSRLACRRWLEVAMTG
jgi:hypothetical protein